MNNSTVVGGSPADLLIIGAGPGGYRAAEYAAKQGLKVIIFEADNVGGTCLNVGCIPTKTYVHSATFVEARERMAQVVPQLRAGVETILSHPNITLVRGRAQLVDANTVSVGSDSVAAKNIIIATGSETKWLPIKGIDDPRVVDSTGLLNLDTLPKRLAIIGAGVIGMEFASVFNRFGSEVTVIEYLKECLPALDSDIAKRLRKTMEKRGVTFKMKTAVENVADIDADVILMATGRRPRTEGLCLDRVGIGLPNANSPIPVDDNFRVVSGSAADIYAIGDVNGKQMLAQCWPMLLRCRPCVPSTTFSVVRTTSASTSCLQLSSPNLKPPASVPPRTPSRPPQWLAILPPRQRRATPAASPSGAPTAKPSLWVKRRVCSNSSPMSTTASLAATPMVPIVPTSFKRSLP